MRLNTKVILFRSTLFYAAAALFITIFSSALLFGAPKVRAASCDKVNIVYCGLSGSTTQQYIDSIKNYYSSSKDSYGNTDIRQVMQWAGWNQSIINSMNTGNTMTGTLSRNGDITVNGRVVGTDTSVSARFGAGQAHFYYIEGNVYYRKTTVSFEHDTRPVLIHFGTNGYADAGIITDCGNTIKFTPTPPPPAVVQCTGLTSAIIDQSKYIYSFTANAQATNATLTGASFDFGDGSKSSGKVSGTTATAQHKYTNSNTYTIVATLSFSAYGATQTKTCQTKLVVSIAYYGCVGSLTGALVDQSNKYNYVYTATMKYGNGATFNSATFDFGDGNTTTVTKAANETTVQGTHDYTKGGDYIITATLKFNVNGGVVAVAPCTMKQSVINPYENCVELTGSILDQSKHSYQFVATMDYGNGATFENADFDFGDGTTSTGVQSSGKKTVSIDHTYAKPGTYDIDATLHFMVNGKVVSAATCKAMVTPTTPPTPECKSGVPVGDVRCNPCQYDSSITADAKDANGNSLCVAPVTSLPNTGSGNVIAVGVVAIIGGFLWYRHLLFKRHKKEFFAADFGTSPLPLGEPLESSDPLAATPLEPKRHRLSLRRRRQF